MIVEFTEKVGIQVLCAAQGAGSTISQHGCLHSVRASVCGDHVASSGLHVQHIRERSQFSLQR